MCLGAPRRLFTSHQGVTGMGVGAFRVGSAVCWRQRGQSSGLRGLSSRWAVAAARVVRFWGCWERRQTQANQTSPTASRSTSQYHVIGIGSLILWVANEQDFRKGSEDAGGCQAVNAHGTELSTLKRGSTRVKHIGRKLSDTGLILHGN